MVSYLFWTLGSLTQGQGQHTAEQVEELKKRKEKMESHLAREVEEMHQFRQASYAVHLNVDSTKFEGSVTKVKI